MLTLDLPFPPTLNTYYRAFQGRVLLSKKGRQYKEDVLAHVLQQCRGRPEIMLGRLRVEIYLHFPTRRQCDVDNRIKATLDALENAGVYENDSQVDHLTVVRRDVVSGGACTVVVSEIPKG